jgi:hypothetical protein
MQIECDKITDARECVRIVEENIAGQRAHIAELERRGLNAFLAGELLLISLRFRRTLLENLLKIKNNFGDGCHGIRETGPLAAVKPINLACTPLLVLNRHNDPGTNICEQPLLNRLQ